MYIPYDGTRRPLSIVPLQCVGYTNRSIPLHGVPLTLTLPRLNGRPAGRRREATGRGRFEAGLAVSPRCCCMRAPGSVVDYYFYASLGSSLHARVPACPPQFDSVMNIYVCT